MSFILGAKPGDHKFLFDLLAQSNQTFEVLENDGTIRRYRYTNNLSINESNPNVFVNILDYIEITPKRKKLHLVSGRTWVKIRACIHEAKIMVLYT